MKQVTVEQATQRLGDLVDAAVGGEDVVVVRNDRAAVRLVPVSTNGGGGRPVFGSAKGLIEISDDFDAPLADLGEYVE